MRIAVATWTNEIVGGAEEHLKRLISAWTSTGHEVALWTQRQTRSAERAFDSVAGVHWSAERLGLESSFRSLRAWRPDVLYSNGTSDPAIDLDLARVAPSAFSAHDFRATCVSGTKLRTLPRAMPCSRTLGPACLVAFFPCRCGGRNPIRAVHEYTRKVTWLRVLREYGALIVHSDSMAREYSRHGFDPVRIYCEVRRGVVPLPSRADGGTWRLLFIGLLANHKGGSVLLEAITELRRRTSARIEISFVGDGPARERWERHAARMVRAHSDVSVRFLGWIADPMNDEAVYSNDLLVVPSLWPEPFGLVGLEAAARGIPAAAFATGGIPEWLRDGVSGAVAPVAPPTSAGLADAIVRCLGDRRRYAALCAGALATYAEFAARDAPRELLSVLERVRRMSAPSSPSCASSNGTRYDRP